MEIVGERVPTVILLACPSCNLGQAHFYPQFIHDFVHALCLKGLLKLMRAAGIRIVKSESELPSKCLK